MQSLFYDAARVKKHISNHYSLLYYMTRYNDVCHVSSLYAPSQSTPFPLKPPLHVHSKLPGVFSHVAIAWQLSVLSVHSSTSASYRQRNIIKYNGFNDTFLTAIHEC